MVAASLSAGALAGGCGGSDHLSKSEYVKRFRAATHEVLVAGQKNGALISGPPAQRLARDVRAAAILRRLASRIGGLDAADAVRKPQEQFVAAVRDQAAELDRAVAAYRAGNHAPLAAIERRGGPSPDIAEREDKALEEFKKKGYAVANID